MKTKPESPANMEHKIQELARRISGYCVSFYDRATPEQKEQLFALLEDLENTMVAYRQYDAPWDSMLIEVVKDYEGRKVKVNEISTFDSVMDKARSVFEFITTN